MINRQNVFVARSGAGLSLNLYGNILIVDNISFDNEKVRQLGEEKHKPQLGQCSLAPKYDTPPHPLVYVLDVKLHS